MPIHFSNMPIRFFLYACIGISGHQKGHILALIRMWIMKCAKYRAILGPNMRIDISDMPIGNSDTCDMG